VIFFGSLKVLKFIENIITTIIAKIVIKSDVLETSENTKKARIIERTLFTFVYGTITEIFSSLYIHCRI